MGGEGCAITRLIFYNICIYKTKIVYEFPFANELENKLIASINVQ